MYIRTYFKYQAIIEHFHTHYCASHFHTHYCAKCKLVKTFPDNNFTLYAKSLF